MLMPVSGNTKRRFAGLPATTKAGTVPAPAAMSIYKRCNLDEIEAVQRRMSGR